MTEARREQVEQAIRDIHAFYQKGKKVPPKGKKKKTRRGKAVTMEQIAKRSGLNRDTTFKARQFSHKDTGYTPEELDKLFQHMRQVQPDQDPKKHQVFTRSKIIRLLAVQPKTRRAELQRRAIDEGWSERRLRAYISAEFGARKPGGREPSIAGEVTAFLGDLEREIQRWRRRYVLLERSPDHSRKHVRRKDLARQVRDKLAAVDHAMKELHSSVIKQLTEENQGWRPRLPMSAVAKLAAVDRKSGQSQ